MDFLGISGPEAIIIAVVVLAVLGPKGMSEAARRIIDVRKRYQALTASFRQQSDQAMAQLRAYADGAVQEDRAANTPQSPQNTEPEARTFEESSTTGREADL